MAGPYTTYGVDNSQKWPVTALTRCKRILVQENYNSANPPTADLQQYNPDGSGPIAIPKGTPASFNSFAGVIFQPGQIVGYVNTPSGSITVQQVESDLL